MPNRTAESPLLRFWNWISFTDRRLRQLKDEGCTIEVGELLPGPDERILETDFGYGREYWLAPAGPMLVQKKPRLVKGGRLILDGERPLSSDESLKQLGLSVRIEGPVKFG
jgi:hypothetical protein